MGFIEHLQFITIGIVLVTAVWFLIAWYELPRDYLGNVTQPMREFSFVDWFSFLRDFMAPAFILIALAGVWIVVGVMSWI